MQILSPLEKKLIAADQIAISNWRLNKWYKVCMQLRKSLHTFRVAHQAGTYPRFSSLPGWDASPSQGYPQWEIRRKSFIPVPGQRKAL